MIELKPKKYLILIIIFFELIFLFNFYYYLKNIWFLITTFLIIIVTLLNFRTKIVLDNKNLNYSGLVTNKKIIIQDINLIKLNNETQHPYITFLGKKDNRQKSMIIKVLISFYKRKDLRTLINEIIKINPNITLDNKIKKIINSAS